jgi:hypothetical protein
MQTVSLEKQKKKLTDYESSFGAERFGTSCLASPSTRSYNKRVSGYGATHLRPNPCFAPQTSDTRQPLYAIAYEEVIKWD